MKLLKLKTYLTLKKKKMSVRLQIFSKVKLKRLEIYKIRYYKNIIRILIQINATNVDINLKELIIK